MDTSTHEAQLLTVGDVAELFGMSKKSIYRRVERGEIPAIKLGGGPQAPIRINRDDLVTWLADAYTTHPGGEAR
jgi:excisionase family DNA binding protein